MLHQDVATINLQHCNCMLQASSTAIATTPPLYDVLVALLLSCSSPAGQALLAAFLAPCAPDALLHLVCCLPDLIQPLDVEQGKA
jgi:hypothetical protein